MAPMETRFAVLLLSVALAAAAFFYSAVGDFLRFL
jgi:hypothetical protein